MTPEDWETGMEPINKRNGKTNSDFFQSGKLIKKKQTTKWESQDGAKDQRVLQDLLLSLLYPLSFFLPRGVHFHPFC